MLQLCQKPLITPPPGISSLSNPVSDRKSELQSDIGQAPLVIKSLTKVAKTGFAGCRSLQLLKNVSLVLPMGSMTGFIGNNGAGKTTTIKCILGFLRPTSGEISYFGGQCFSTEVLAKIGYLPENPRYPSHLTGRGFLELHARLSGFSGEKSRSLASEWLEKIGMEASALNSIGTYSKGMQQRLGLAQALLHRPDLIVLDEPMSGLDPLGRKVVREILISENNRGATVFFSTHLLSDVERICSHAVIVRDGCTQPFEGEIRESKIEEMLKL